MDENDISRFPEKDLRGGGRIGAFLPPYATAYNKPITAYIWSPKLWYLYLKLLNFWCPKYSSWAGHRFMLNSKICACFQENRLRKYKCAYFCLACQFLSLKLLLYRKFSGQYNGPSKKTPKVLAISKNKICQIKLSEYEPLKKYSTWIYREISLFHRVLIFWSMQAIPKLCHLQNTTTLYKLTRNPNTPKVKKALQKGNMNIFTINTPFSERNVSAF